MGRDDDYGYDKDTAPNQLTVDGSAVSNLN